MKNMTPCNIQLPSYKARLGSMCCVIREIEGFKICDEADELQKELHSAIVYLRRLVNSSAGSLEQFSSTKKKKKGRERQSGHRKGRCSPGRIKRTWSVRH